MIPLEIVSTLAGLIIPAAFDFIKKKFIPSENDTPERTISTLAVSGKCENIPSIVDAYAKLYEAKTKFFNRDVIGNPSQFVVDLRAIIRPLTVAISLLIYTIGVLLNIDLPQEFTIPASSWIGLWFGDRMRAKL